MPLAYFILGYLYKMLIFYQRLNWKLLKEPVQFTPTVSNNAETPSRASRLSARDHPVTLQSNRIHNA